VRVALTHERIETRSMALALGRELSFFRACAEMIGQSEDLLTSFSASTVACALLHKTSALDAGPISLK